MNTQQKRTASLSYNRFFQNNCKVGYISDLKKCNIKELEYSFEVEIDEAYSGYETTCKTLLESNNWVILSSTINPRKFIAIYNAK